MKKTAREIAQEKHERAENELNEINDLIAKAKQKQIDGRKEEIELTLKKQEIKGKLSARKEDLDELEK